MYKMPKIVLGVAPTKRGFLSMEEAKRQKDKFMSVIRSIDSDVVEIVDVDDLCENGILTSSFTDPTKTTQDIQNVIDKFVKARVDALFIPHCDFGEEQCSTAVAAALKVPTLLWGARDERPNTFESRGRDTQCGMFACSKVLRRYNVPFSYIWNCETESEDFKNGFDSFIRVVNVVKTVRSLRIAKFGARPQPFMSCMDNVGELATRYGITTVPISPNSVAKLADDLTAEGSEEFKAYVADFTSRFETEMPKEKVERSAAITMAVEKLMERNNCSVGAMECWTATPIFGVPVCPTMGEMADRGYPLSCETDVNGAVTMAILRAVTLNRQAEFLADLTIRHPENDNAELLWHCGPFPYSLKNEQSTARLVNGQESFYLQDGDLTVCRFDEVDGKHYLFCGEGKTTTGPETTGTYLWLEVDNWKRWEEKLIFGPYIHHVGGTYGSYKKELREAARYLGMIFDDADVQGTASL